MGIKELTIEEIKNLGNLESETFHIKYGKAETYYDTLKNPDNTLLSSRGKIILNKRTNMLFVEDTEGKIQGIKEYIKKDGGYIVMSTNKTVSISREKKEEFLKEVEKHSNFDIPERNFQEIKKELYIR